MIARIEAMGGNYTPHLEQDHTHFLIAWKGEGEKWQAATEWGTPVVSREWLRACEMRRGVCVCVCVCVCEREREGVGYCCGVTRVVAGL